ncbi:CpsD/CapB family tyrosine-protein kinase [Actinoplanes sp. NPDC026670]|uniref:polysaccharide biosynthesis tyrosine autokinase n=1 Tax=Actinoplanes sp. NPDC026670 TaxID=3154700 RepID=UPI0033FB2BF0
MTTYGRAARILHRYGPWVLVVTAAAGAAAWGLHRVAPAPYRTETTVLVGARHDLVTERQIIASDAVALPAAAGLGIDATRLLAGLTVEPAGPDVLRFVYTADDGFSARVRARALAESYTAYRPGSSVLTEPYLPTAPTVRALVPDLAAGLLAGLLLGAGTAFLRARTRGAIRDRDDYAALIGRPVLVTVPRHRRAEGPPIVLREPGSPAAESYRYLRSRLQSSLRPTGATTLLVTSPGDRQGRTTTAANLAVALARSGRSVVLVDADLRNPRLHHIFQTTVDHGLTTLLDGDATVSEVLERTPVPRLRLIPAGPRGDEHTDLLDSGQLGRVLRAVQKHADVIILDSPAVLSAADSIALAALSDHVLFVADFARTRRDTVRRALAELAEVLHGNVSPVLVNVPKSAGALAPRTRTRPGISPTPIRDRLFSDADDVAPPAVTSYSYVDVEDTQDDPMADYHARTKTVAIPVIYGAPAAPSTPAAPTEPASAAAGLSTPAAPTEPASAPAAPASPATPSKPAPLPEPASAAAAAAPSVPAPPAPAAVGSGKQTPPGGRSPSAADRKPSSGGRPDEAERINPVGSVTTPAAASD